MTREREPKFVDRAAFERVVNPGDLVLLVLDNDGRGTFGGPIQLTGLYCPSEQREDLGEVRPTGTYCLEEENIIGIYTEGTIHPFSYRGVLSFLVPLRREQILAHLKRNFKVEVASAYEERFWERE